MRSKITDTGYQKGLRNIESNSKARSIIGKINANSLPLNEGLGEGLKNEN